jgi:hypothetical protein
VTAVPAQTPFVQMSFVVQSLPSLHIVPFGSGGLEHRPDVRSQVPAAWHGSLAVHTIGVPAHVPPVHTSPTSQRSPSLHVVPSGAFAKEHVPSPLQVPACWHWPGAAQV